LFSGNKINQNNIYLYAIDANDSIYWKFDVIQDLKGEPIDILSNFDSFIVKYDSNVVSLNKYTGGINWKVRERNFVTKIYKWKNKILLYSLIDSIPYENKKVSSIIELKMIDFNGKVLWENSFLFGISVKIGLIGNNLLISDSENFLNLSLFNGKILTSKNENNDNEFEMIMDICDGNYYLYSYNGNIYW
jgi:hypothetical protein